MKPATKEEIENEKFLQMLKDQTELEITTPGIFFMEGGRTYRSYKPAQKEPKESNNVTLGFMNDDLHQMSADSNIGD